MQKYLQQERNVVLYLTVKMTEHLRHRFQRLGYGGHVGQWNARSGHPLQISRWDCSLEML